MRNLTVAVDEDVAEWARVFAAKRGSSVSRVVGELLAERMRQEEGYEAAMDDFFSRGPARLKEPGARYPTRDESHER